MDPLLTPSDCQRFLLPPSLAVALFCARIDHWGDLGVTWRLARAIAAYGATVIWWVDDPQAARHFLAGASKESARIVLRHWHRHTPQSEEVALLASTAVIVEAFACGFSNAWLEAFARRSPPPVWLILEHLTFGRWAAEIDGRSSPHPRLPLTAHWCVPGFVSGSAGLPGEADEIAALDDWASEPSAVSAWLRQLTPVAAANYRRCTLFCYRDAPLSGFLAALAADSTPTLIFVPPGEPRLALARYGLTWANLPPPPQGAALPPIAWGGTPHLWQPLPFLAPDDFDRLLWSSHLNWVRGEDSFVRAQWAARPFVWSPYRRSDGGHRDFAATFRAQFSGDWPLADCEEQFIDVPLWQKAWVTHSEWTDHCQGWRATIRSLPSLAETLLSRAIFNLSSQCSTLSQKGRDESTHGQGVGDEVSRRKSTI